MKDTKQIRVMRALTEAGSGIRFHYWDREDTLQAMRRNRGPQLDPVKSVTQTHPSGLTAANYD